jgi:hypothetical protein
MAFRITSHSITLDGGGALRATCQVSDQEWRQSSLRLGDHIGNRDGRFSFAETNFERSAEDIQLLEDGTVLSAKLYRGYGKTCATDTLNLNLWVANINGTLKFRKPFVPTLDLFF